MHSFDEAQFLAEFARPHWKGVLTCIGGTMANVGANSAFGAAAWRSASESCLPQTIPGEGQAQQRLLQLLQLFEDYKFSEEKKKRESSQVRDHPLPKAVGVVGVRIKSSSRPRSR